MMLSAGKLRGLTCLADPSGRFRMTAVDQRPPIMNLIRERTGREPTYDQVADVKRMLVRHLAARSSALLLDPIWAWPRAWRDMPGNRGLIMTLEDHRFDERDGQRLSSAIPDWSVGKIKRMGGDGVKILAWYRPDAAPDILAHQKAFVRSVGEACRAHDIPFVFEVLVYPLPGDAGQTREYVEQTGKRAEHVLACVETFAAPEYHVDLFKLESPLPAASVPDPDSRQAAEAQALFDRMGQLATRPWVMLSAGADPAAFRRILTFAYRAGASGYLAGRAIWAEAFGHYPDTDRIAGELDARAAAYMDDLNELTERLARPWTDHGAFADGLEMAGSDENFPRRYSETGQTE